MVKVFEQVVQEFDAKYLKVDANVRYWEDAIVNGEEDTEGDLIPCRNGDWWCPIIDIDTGEIVNWKNGTAAKIHYKVADAGVYTLQTANNETIMEQDGYVPSCMSPGGSGYGDYIIMNIDENGMIENWEFVAEYWEDENEAY